ncbi:unnamed protein product [Psylliodes chrysocephalus]|uniref:Uncharacterized protein n=1 Tax=Psylliodes chrysocephalus TaxID=3402493 RepID=A0A9P0D0M4_9CUCU|nr:unnamed protein product [Psylliodes chrysocephala]
MPEVLAVGHHLTRSMTQQDELILSTIAPTAITGDMNVNETPIDFQFASIDEKDEPTDMSEEYVQGEANEIVLDDHIYSKENIVPLSSSNSKNKRTVASQRLRTSAIAATTLAEVSRSTLDVQKEYYDKKLQLLERQVVAVENLVDFFKQRNNF